MSFNAIINSPLGKLGIRLQHDKLTGIDFLNSNHKLFLPEKDKTFAKICDQLEKYFTEKNYLFSINLDYQGTEFQKKVWQALQKIPYGKTKTYGELAQELKTSARAIGNACRRNPIPIVIPCHRILAKNNLGGYNGAIAGTMLDIKSWLLEHECSIY